MPIFTRLFAISIEAKSVLGFSSSDTILLYDGCCRVLSILMSFTVNEKKATSEPETKNDSKKRMITVKRSIEIAAGVNATKFNNVQ